jgi:hypothetical protein
MAPDLVNIYDRLYSYCKTHDFAGYDPFDGLNSRLFQVLPVKHFAFARLAWLQMVKRSPVDLRSLLRVQKGANPKGLALFALAELSRSRATQDPQHSDNARDLLEKLAGMRFEEKTPAGKTAAAFGYNFDWQSRSFYAPIGTPTVVPSAFAAQAFVEGYEFFGDDRYLDLAEGGCEFIVSGLNRPVETKDELCFSYTPVDHGVIFNASLLAGETLASVGTIIENSEYLAMAAKATRFVVRRQRSDGAWAYGENVRQQWVDNFHTAYILLSLFRISSRIPPLRNETHDAIKIGTDLWLNKFFLDDGTPKYYDNAVFPVDIHSAAVAVAALCELKPVDERMIGMARKTVEWTISKMLDPNGFFYYQKRKNLTIKTPFMRWGQAWMAYALARLIETEKEISGTR